MAEEIRDSILFVAGQLKESMGGQLLPDANRAYVTGTGSKQGTYDFPNRSVYLPVLRSAVYKVLQAFDFPDPAVQSGSRQTSTIAPQALFMLNSKLVLDASEELGTQLSNEQSDDRTKIQSLIKSCYGRVGSAEEVSNYLGYLDRARKNFQGKTSEPGQDSETANERAWQSLCRIVFSSSEFYFLWTSGKASRSLSKTK